MKKWFVKKLDEAKLLVVRALIKVTKAVYEIYRVLHETVLDVSGGFEEAEKALWNTLVDLQGLLK